MMRNRPWLVFALVFGWKIALFVFTAQPVPANDAFFYDGAVIHHLLHGGYYNPCLKLALPISGGEVFSAYPPLWQAALLGWGSIFGVTALAVMALHIVLFGLYLLVLLAIFRRLQTPGWCVNVTGLFLLTFTFHDRPDSLAHLLGVLAVYACIRSREILCGIKMPDLIWTWIMALCAVLTFCTSLQIGATYFMVVGIATVAACHLGKERMPSLAFISMAAGPIVFALLIKFALPRAWAGFLEHVHETPTLTGLRMPHWQEMAKLVRTVPGILVVAVALPLSWFKQHYDFSTDAGRRHELLLLAALLTALAILVGCLTVLTANTVAIANYLQPLIVAMYLGLSSSFQMGKGWLRWQVVFLTPAILIGSVRAIGMTTWGVACAADVSYGDSVQIIDRELANQPAHAKIVMSSAFLYTGAKHNDLELIHSDWMARAGGDSRVTDVDALMKLKPQKLILTQYDYYRRFELVLNHAEGNPQLKQILIVNTAKTHPPDFYKKFQLLVQHVSWAPVIVNLTWSTTPNPQH